VFLKIALEMPSRTKLGLAFLFLARFSFYGFVPYFRFLGGLDWR
jgi:hypothetical protein